MRAWVLLMAFILGDPPVGRGAHDGYSIRVDRDFVQDHCGAEIAKANQIQPPLLFELFIKDSPITITDHKWDYVLCLPTSGVEKEINIIFQNSQRHGESTHVSRSYCLSNSRRVGFASPNEVIGEFLQGHFCFIEYAPCRGHVDCWTHAAVSQIKSEAGDQIIALPVEGRCDGQDAWRLNACPLCRSERFLRNFIRPSGSASSTRCVEEYSHQQGNFDPGNDYLSSGKPSKLVCRLGHAPLLAQVGVCAVIGLIAGVSFWKGIGAYLSIGRISKRVVLLVGIALALYAAAISLAFVFGEASSYNSGIEQYYCGDHPSLSLTV